MLLLEFEGELSRTGFVFDLSKFRFAIMDFTFGDFTCPLVFSIVLWYSKSNQITLGGGIIAASYKKRCKLLIDKDMKKKDHCISEGCGDKAQSRHFEADRNAGSEMKKIRFGV